MIKKLLFTLKFALDVYILSILIIFIVIGIVVIIKKVTRKQA